jgi:hypothetical protein
MKHRLPTATVDEQVVGFLPNFEPSRNRSKLPEFKVVSRVPLSYGFHWSPCSLKQSLAVAGASLIMRKLGSAPPPPEWQR